MLTIKQLNTKIRSVEKRSTTLRADIQVILINAAGHAYAHRDVSTFSRLFTSVKGADRTAMATWIREYGFALLQKDGTFRLNKAEHKNADFVDGDDCVNYLTDNAPLWDATAPSAEDIVQNMDVARLIELLATKIKNAGSPASAKKVNVILDTAKTVTALEHLRASIQDKALEAANAQAAKDRADHATAQREADEEEVYGIAAE